MPNDSSRIVVSDIDIPFGSLVLFFVKAAFAAIPAAIIVTAVLAVIGILLRMAFGFGFGHMGWMMG